MRHEFLLKSSIIFLLPILIFLLAAGFLAFNEPFYKKEFSKYNVYGNVQNATLLHRQVLSFVQGKSAELPGQFNEREKQHLWDVRNAISASKILADVLVILLIILLYFSAFALKDKNKIMSFLGKSLFFGGLATVAAAGILFLLVSLNFLPTFESFHRLFFKSGTYTFDPSSELIVNLYPEGLFMDLGIRISAGVAVISLVIVMLGTHLMLRHKAKRI